MTKVTNEQVCHTIARLSEKYPKLRVMQLIVNAVPQDVIERLHYDLYYIDNEDLLSYLLCYEADVLATGGVIDERD